MTRDFDRDASRYPLSSDGKLVYLLVPEAGKENLYRVAAQGGKPELVIEPATGGEIGLVAVFGDGDALDQLHDEVRPARFRGPGVENAGDVARV